MKKTLLMEVKRIKKIITAIGNPILNNELKELEEFAVIGNDIQYQDGILELLEIDNKINFIIISELIPGEYKIEELIGKINNINNEIKIIIILENKNKIIENKMLEKNIYKIFYNNQIEIKDIINLINENDKMEKYNYEIRKEINELKEIIKNNQKNNIIENRNNIIKNKKILFKNNNKIKNILKIINNKLINNYKKYLKINKKIIKNNIINNLNKKYYEKNIIENNNKIISVLGNNGARKKYVFNNVG